MEGQRGLPRRARLARVSACSSGSSSSSAGGSSSSGGAAAGSSSGAASAPASGSAGASTSGGAAPAFTGKPLVIGASVSLTGDFADSGKAVKAGYELWADTVNAQGGILGRQVEFKIVDDTSSPTQVVTNYQNLINKDKVDLVFGPFSSLLTVPGLAGGQALRLRLPRAGRRWPGRLRAEPAQPLLRPAGPGDQVGRRLRRLDPLAARSGPAEDGRLRRAGRPVRGTDRRETSGPGSRPPASRPSTSRSIRPRRRTSPPSWRRSPRPSPDVLVSGTQSEDAYGQVKSLVQLKFSPKFMFMSNGANSPLEFPDKVGAAQHRPASCRPATGSRAPRRPAAPSSPRPTSRRTAGPRDTIDNSSAEAYAAGQLLEEVAKKTGKVDNATIISTLHQGTWPTLLGDLSWDAQRRSRAAASTWSSGRAASCCRSSRRSRAGRRRSYPKPAWGG